MFCVLTYFVPEKFANLPIKIPSEFFRENLTLGERVILPGAKYERVNGYFRDFRFHSAEFNYFVEVDEV